MPSDGETIGEVFMRGNIMMKGYLKDPKATQEVFASGWFHTGDRGVMHENGYIEIRETPAVAVEHRQGPEIDRVLRDAPDEGVADGVQIGAATME